MITKDAPEPLMRMALRYCPMLAKIHEGAIVAGGFIRAYYAKETPADIDIYFRTAEAAQEALDLFAEEKHYHEVARTERAVSYKDDQGRTVQVITMITGEPNAIITEFDFTVCSACLTMQRTLIPPKNDAISIELWDDFINERGEFDMLPAELQEALLVEQESLGNESPYMWAGHVMFNEDFFEHLAGRLLHFTGSRMPLASLARAFKYQKKGYTICDGNIIALARAVSEVVDFTDEAAVQLHIQGMDINRFD